MSLYEKVLSEQKRLFEQGRKRYQEGMPQPEPYTSAHEGWMAEKLIQQILLSRTKRVEEIAQTISLMEE